MMVLPHYILLPSNGHLDATKYLISQGAKVNNGGTEGLAPLHLAAESGHLAVAKFLISQGAEVKQDNNDGFLPHYILLHRMVILMPLNISSVKEPRLLFNWLRPNRS